MTVHEAIQIAERKIGLSDAKWLMSHFFGCGLADLKLYFNNEIDLGKLARFNGAAQKRQGGVPLQYIVRSANFFGLELYVDSGVLIPRPETEELVELFLTDQVGLKEGVVFDIGTGSGAIALAIKSSRSNLEVLASDISGRALAVAERNSKDSKLKIELQEGYLLEPWQLHLQSCSQPCLQGAIIVANLPYVDEDDPDLALEVKMHEPLIALTPQTRKHSTINFQAAWLADELFMQIEQYKNPIDAFYLELSEPVIDAILLKWGDSEFPYDFTSKKDLHGNLRFLIGKKKRT